MIVSTNSNIVADQHENNAHSGPIRVALLSDRVLLRESLAHRLAAEPGFDLVAESATSAQALDKIAGVDVLILDMPAAREFVAMAREGGFSGKVLVVATDVDPGASAIALRQGAAGIFLECGSSARLMQAIRMIAGGEAWIDPELLLLLAERYPHYQDRGLKGLTKRDEMVLEGLVGGLSNRKIAQRLGTSESTIKNTLQQLFTKASVRTRSQLVRIALEGKHTKP